MGSSKLVAAILSLLDLCVDLQNTREKKTKNVESKSTNTLLSDEENTQDTFILREIASQTALLRNQMCEYETRSKNESENAMMKLREEFEHHERNASSETRHLFRQEIEEHEATVKNEREKFREYELNTSIANNVLREEFEFKLQNVHSDKEMEKTRLHRELEEARTFIVRAKYLNRTLKRKTIQARHGENWRRNCWTVQRRYVTEMNP